MENEKKKKKEYYINGIRMIPTEDEEQAWLFSWAKLRENKFPELCLLHHIPNGGKRSKSEAARFKAMGVKPGVADLFLPVARCGYHGLYIELKALDGKVSAEQKNFLAAAKEQGFLCAVMYGGQAAAELIESYLRGEVSPE